jgi:hypothetical protein
MIKGLILVLALLATGKVRERHRRTTVSGSAAWSKKKPRQKRG